MTRLWKVVSGQLAEVATASPKSESIVEDWIAKAPLILELDLLIIARQFTTDFGGRIDLLGIDREGDLTLIEMKRDRTPRGPWTTVAGSRALRHLASTASPTSSSKSPCPKPFTIGLIKTSQTL
jgi:Endonuclease NucS